MVFCTGAKPAKGGSARAVAGAIVEVAFDDGSTSLEAMVGTNSPARKNRIGWRTTPH